MTADHTGTIFDGAHFHSDTFRDWVVGTPLPLGEFVTRWVTHLCAPTFVLLAGASLALSAEKRAGKPGQTRFIVTRGLLIAALDPIWMSLGFSAYERIAAQVLYAIGLSMVCMAWLRRLSSTTLLAFALAIQAFGELSLQFDPQVQPLRTLWRYLIAGGQTFGASGCRYPVLPWLSIMMLGWVFGRWLITPRSNAARARSLALVGVALLAVFAVVRGINDYGNWGLYRDSTDVLQWLHVNKYPPSITFVTLELGLAFLVLAGMFALDDPTKPRRAFSVLGLFGSTAFLFYLLHVHLAGLAQLILDVDRTEYGLAKTWISAAIVVLALAGPCWLYRRYKSAHPDGWTRYL